MNGVEESYNTSGSETINTTTENVVIAQSPFAAGTDRQFQGSLDDVRIYDTDLTAEQVLELSNQGKR